MKIEKPHRINFLKVRFWYEKCVAFLSFAAFVALASAVFYWASHLLKPGQ
jgi:hypothetical protein